ncbi:MAG: hypothetical protein STSR0008_20170 [Ignavibacterium sp.]
MKTILDYKDEWFDHILAWAMYLFWADLHRRQFESWMETEPDIDDSEVESEFIARLSAWYSSLWVVIEGWKELSLSDKYVDELLTSAPRYMDLLKRHRNGVFHYQPNLLHKKLVDFLDAGEGAMFWVHLLHNEFCRFYFDLIENAPMPPALLSELKKSIVGIVGWIPNHIPEARVREIRELENSAISMLKETGDFSSPEAVKLLEAVLESNELLTQVDIDIKSIRAMMLRKIKEESKKF